ncbi:MAG: hypothetical protein H7A51_07625 [Akkermansiaceae bacterium]|nr:hypothetical protein [Akkermansiaceae bacterium]
MATTQVHYSEYIKQGLFIIVVIALALFGVKSCRKYQQKRAVIVELSSNASESAAYEQFYAENAQSNLYKSMHQMYLGVQLGLTPAEILASVMEVDDTFFSTEKDEELPIRQVLIRDALLSNYDNCVKLAIFEDANNIEQLADGQPPTIQSGPATGEKATLQQIIPGSVLPGVDKLLPNLVISPPQEVSSEAKATSFDDFKIARAKKLAQDLANAGLIERDAHKKIVEFYDRVSTTVTTPEVPTPEAPPSPKTPPVPTP